MFNLAVWMIVMVFLKLKTEHFLSLALKKRNHYFRTFIGKNSPL